MPPKVSVSKESADKGKLQAFDPMTGEHLGDFTATDPAEVAAIVDQARKVFPEWAAIPPQGRARMLKQVRHKIYEHLDEIVEVIHSQTGKPRAEALSIDVIPVVLDLLYYERVAHKILRTETRARIGSALLLGGRSKVERRPFGVVGVISPWNYPFSLAMAGVLPAVFAGNTVVLKPSEITPGVGEVLKKVFEPLPSGVVNIVQGAADVGAALVDAPCDKLCFIGSPTVGRKIAEAAAKHLTPVVMELGGMDPAIVLEDADLDVASSGVLWGAFVNAGQTCAAAERAYIVDSVYDEFKEKLVSKLASLRTLTPDGDVGPIALERQYEIVKRHVEDAVAKGATVLGGGPERAVENADRSYWYPPTILENVNDEMVMSQEETFGPVLPMTRVADVQDAIRQANEDGFNLTASVYSKDADKARWVGDELRAGMIGINDFGAVGFGAPWGPWGGIGASGYGRVKGPEGLLEFTYPVHVVKAVGPSMKRFYWYPYEEGTRQAFRSVAELLSAPTVGEKAKALKGAVTGLSKALRSKV